MTNTQDTYWTCRGPKEDPHPEEEVEAGEPCPICEREYTPPDRKGGGSSLPLGKILAGVALLVLVGIGGYFIVDIIDNGGGEEQVDREDPPPPCPNGSPPPCLPQPPNGRTYSWEPEKFTWGQRTLFPGTNSPNETKGIEAFQQGDYEQAEDKFEQAVIANRSNPEPLIMLNNAKAHQQGNPLTLGVVVPVTGNINSAREMLRGVAMAQNEFNAAGGIGGRLLEIVIANDSNDVEDAEQVAQQLAQDPTILGVVGHNSSSASEAGLKVYEANDLAMISPTSTSTSLQGDVFFRTTPSDAAAAQQLAQYASEELNLSTVVVFYNSESSYSRSLRENFESRFDGDIAQSIDMSATNFDPERKVKESALIEEAQAALLFPNTGTVEVARQIAINNARLEPDERLQLLGGDALYNPETLTEGGASVLGLVLAVPWSIQSQTSQEFKREGTEQWGGFVNWRTAMSYDATQAFIESFSINENTRASVLENLRQVQLEPSETSGREVRFTSQGERQGQPVLVRVEKNPPVKLPGTDFGFNLVQ